MSKFDFEMPEYLKKSIEGYEKAKAEGRELLDCEMDDIYGSANMAFISRAITEEQARKIQRYYCFGENDESV